MFLLLMQIHSTNFFGPYDSRGAFCLFDAILIDSSKNLCFLLDMRCKSLEDLLEHFSLPLMQINTTLLSRDFEAFSAVRVGAAREVSSALGATAVG
jgi:hypothetical protein